MASSDEIDRLIAEADAALGRRPTGGPAAPGSGAARSGAPGSTAAGSAAGAVERVPRRFESPLKVSAVSGGVAAALVFATFAVLPFFGAFSGAAGAFVATFFIVLGQRLFGRRRK